MTAERHAPERTSAPRGRLAGALAATFVLAGGVWAWLEYGSVEARKRHYIADADAVNINDLARRYDADAVAAHRAWKFRVVKVSGTVATYGPWCSGLCLAEGVECSAPGDDAHLYRDGQRATVVGTVEDWSESAHRVRLGRCYIVP